MAVYMVQAGDGGPVKIGLTSNEGLINRLGMMQSNNHVRLTLLRVLDGGSAVERSLHRAFADLRLHGEWFSYSPDMIGDVGVPDWEPADRMKPWPILRFGSPEHKAAGRIVLPRKRRELPMAARERAKHRSEWLALRSEGHTLTAIADAAGVTKQFVHQVTSA